MVSRNKSSVKKRSSKPRRPEHVNDLFSNSSRVDVNGWIFVRSAGDPYQVGFQNGSLLGNEIVDAIEALKLAGEGYGRNWQFFTETAMNLFWPKLPEEYRREVQGIVDGVAWNRTAHIQLRDVAALNGYFDTVSYHYWLKSKESKTISPLARAEHCSAFIATGNKTADGQVVLAHNTWFQYLPGARYNIILDISPKAGKRFVMQTMAGSISSGTDWYVSQPGLVVAETTITGMTTFNPDGLPYFLRSRKAIQYAESIDEWAKTMVKENNGGYADDWLIANVNTGEIAWLELGTFNHEMKRTRNGFFIGCNMAMSAEVQAETNLDYNDQSSTYRSRQTRLRELLEANEGRLTVEAAKALLADHRDGYSKTDSPNRNSVCGHIEADGRGIPEWEYGPYYPGGCFDGKVTDTDLAKNGAFWAHWGRPCGTPFEVDAFLSNHPEYEWQRPCLKDVRPYPWTLVTASSPPTWRRQE